MSKEKLFESLETNLKIYSTSIKEVASQIIGSEVSNYPVFVAHKAGIGIGKLIIDREDLALDWNINASTLEELVNKSVIADDKLTSFKGAFKDPHSYMCVLLVDNEVANFVFYPYNPTED